MYENTSTSCALLPHKKTAACAITTTRSFRIQEQEILDGEVGLTRPRAEAVKPCYRPMALDNAELGVGQRVETNLCVAGRAFSWTLSTALADELLLRVLPTVLQAAGSWVIMDTLDDTTWDVVIAGTGLHESLLALTALVRPLTWFSLQIALADSLAASIFSHVSVTTYNPESATSTLSFPRAYSLALAPQLLYARSNLLPALVSSRVDTQLEFLAMGSWWADSPLKKLIKVPSGREDLFASQDVTVSQKRSLMKFLRWVADSDGREELLSQKGDEPFENFLTSHFGIDRDIQMPIHALTMSPVSGDRTRTSIAVSRITRHLSSMGVFGPGFGALIPKWGGLAELAQVGCRAGAVGGGVYVLGNGIKALSDASAEAEPQLDITLAQGERIKASWLAGSLDNIPYSDLDMPLSTNSSTDNSMARSITVVSSPLKFIFPQPADGAPASAGAVVAFHGSKSTCAEPDYDDCRTPIHVIVHSSDTGECPSGQCVLYGSTPANEGPRSLQYLNSAVENILKLDPANADGSGPKPAILWRAQYHQRDTHPLQTNGTTPDAVRSGRVLPFPAVSTDLVFDDAVLAMSRAGVKADLESVQPPPHHQEDTSQKQRRPQPAPLRKLARPIVRRRRQRAIHDRRAVRHRPVRPDGVVVKARMLVLAALEEVGRSVEPGAQLAPAVVALAALRIRAAKGQRALTQQHVDVLRGGAVGVVDGGGGDARLLRVGSVGGGGAGEAAGGHGAGGGDDFDVEARAKGGHVGDNEVVRGGDGVVGQRGVELLQAQRGQDAEDVGVMREVKVQRLVEGEGAGHRVERDVDLRRRRVDVVLRQARAQLGDPAGADGAAGWRREAVVACKGEVDGILVTLPLGVGEEGTKGRVAQSNRLVGAEALHVIDVADVEEACRLNQGGDALGRIGEVDGLPVGRGISTGGAAEVVAVGALEVAGERVVEGVLLNDVDQGCVVGPVKTEEAGQKVLGRLAHAVLRGGASNQLGTIVGIQVTVLILVEDTRVKELLLADGDENLFTELVGPIVQEGELARGGEVARVVGNLLGKLAGGGRVACAMAGEHVELGNVGAIGQRVLVHTKARWVGKVVAKLAVQVEYVASTSLGTVQDGNLRLEWLRRDIRHIWERSRIRLG
ncbi:hypothetical protein FH972_021301 [Carpinus fangiana]|uniref:Uncharacterized protein n=1 Tax=Carpinus fangiana TaxID=176857 RepID=A0A5N6KPB9_9ROSI|nr:hypothetical protein FH972_021301 [Carpinus fangiana]